MVHFCWSGFKFSVKLYVVLLDVGLRRYFEIPFAILELQSSQFQLGFQREFCQTSPRLTKYSSTGGNLPSNDKTHTDKSKFSNCQWLRLFASVTFLGLLLSSNSLFLQVALKALRYIPALLRQGQTSLGLYLKLIHGRNFRPIVYACIRFWWPGIHIDGLASDRQVRSTSCHRLTCIIMAEVMLSAQLLSIDHDNAFRGNCLCLLMCFIVSIRLLCFALYIWRIMNHADCKLYLLNSLTLLQSPCFKYLLRAFYWLKRGKELESISRFEQ